MPSGDTAGWVGPILGGDVAGWPGQMPNADTAGWACPMSSVAAPGWVGSMSSGDAAGCVCPMFVSAVFSLSSMQSYYERANNQTSGSMKPELLQHHIKHTKIADRSKQTLRVGHTSSTHEVFGWA